MNVPTYELFGNNKSILSLSWYLFDFIKESLLSRVIFENRSISVFASKN